MNACMGRKISTILILLIVISCFVITVQSHESNKTFAPSIEQIARDVYSLATASSVKSWNRLKTLVNGILHKQLFPPDIEGGGEHVKEAAEKSMGKSKVVVEESAKTAGKKVGEAIHNTAEKAKEEGKSEL